MSELRPPAPSSDAEASTPGAAGPPPEGAGEDGTAPLPAGAAPPPPPAAAPPGPGETPPPPAPPPPVDLSAPEPDEDRDPTGRPDSPPLATAPPAPPVEETPGEPAGAPARRRSWTPVLLVLLLLSVSVGAYFGFRGADDGGDSTAPTTSAASGEFITVNDKEAGFTVSYPEKWSELAPASGEQRLLLSAGGQNYFQVKVRPVDPATVDQQIAEALADVKMVTDPRQFQLNGVKTYYFLYYTPVTEDSPTEGVHAHYFLINGDVLYTMVFQALPTDQFSALAPVFDQVAESFQVDRPAAPGPSGTSPTTTASSPTTAG